jgi:hypothetical protein
VREFPALPDRETCGMEHGILLVPRSSVGRGSAITSVRWMVAMLEKALQVDSLISLHGGFFMMRQPDQ